MKKAVAYIALTAFACAQISCSQISGAGPKPVLKTDSDKQSYMVGVMFGTDIDKMIGQNVGNFTAMDVKLDTAILKYAIIDVLQKRTRLLTEAEVATIKTGFDSLMQEKQATAMAKQQQNMQSAGPESGPKNKEEGEKFLAENKKKAGVKTTASGLQYEVISKGKGAKPTPADRVKVHYVGKLLSGTEFDSSVKRGQPVEFPLNGVIKGWTEGLQLMPVGAKYKFYIPSDLAYGEQGMAQGGIGPNSMLIFEVELIEILK